MRVHRRQDRGWGWQMMVIAMVLLVVVVMGGGDADDGRTEGVGTVVTVVTDAVGEEEGVVGRVVVRGGGL